MTKKIFLLFIIVLAFALRFYRLDIYPALNADEAAIGYNVYSLLQTGMDEHGNPWPIHFQSFNDYKPGLYFYLVLPFVASMGLNEWAVRIPGAALGVLTVLLMYFLAKEISKGFKVKSETFALLASLFLAISPWHIHFSRGGWEVNVSTFFLTLGVLAFFKAKEKTWWYAVSILAFVASIYTYHAARIVAPLLGMALFLMQFKHVRKNIKTFGTAVIIGILLSIPLVIDFTGAAGISRAAGVGLFADPGPLSRINEQRGEHTNYQSIFAKLYHNKAVNYGLALAQNWGSHYWGEFLFLSGDEIQRNRVPETGQMYIIDVIFVLAGIAVAIKKSKRLGFILFWLVVSPLAASLTFQSPHSLRAHNMVIPLILVSALGVTSLLQYFSKYKKYKTILYLVFSVIISWGVVRYLHMYYIHMAKEYPYSSQYGVKELAEFVKESQDVERIVVTDRYDQPYILLLFYLKYPPENFQNNHVLTPRDKFGFSTVREFDKYIFKEVDFNGDKIAYPNSLIIGTDEQIPKEANIIKRIYGSNGYMYFEAVKN